MMAASPRTAQTKCGERMPAQHAHAMKAPRSFSSPLTTARASVSESTSRPLQAVWRPLSPMRQGVRVHFGEYAKDVAKGLALRHDHGS
jgi:hypothetical protein